MRVAYDVISAGGGLGPGSGAMVVFYRGALGALAERPEIDEVVALTQPWSGRLGVPDHPKVRVAPCRGLPRSRIGRVAYEQIVLPGAVARQRPDLLISGHNTTPLLHRGPSVVILHSIGHIFFPEVYSPLRLRYLKRIIPRSLQHADAVITVSEWERREVLARYELDPTRVFAVHSGLSDTVSAALEREGERVTARPVHEPYVFMASTLYGFKNHARLIRAFATLVRAREVPHRLVLAGGDADVTAADLAALAANEGVGERVTFLGPVGHDRVPDLIAGADAIAYTSLCEAFGHPILEALAFGRCLVTSNVASMPEVAGDAAILVDPYDVDSIADGLRTALLDERRRAELERAGPSRAAAFTWERWGRETLGVLQFALERRA
jgi:glycosyltransferase involved in cell wall biosynthesis